MNQLTLLDYSFYFMIYGFLGWIVEVIYVGFRSGNFTNRGFLYLPFLPIYGFGAVIILYCLSSLADNMLLLFLFATILTTSLEYFTAIVLENIFHIKWWDYSTYKFNFQGRICLRNSLLFGLLSVFVIEVVQPLIEKINSYISLNMKEVIVDVFFIVIVIDLYFTLRKLNNMPVKHIHLLNTKNKNIPLELEKLRVNLMHTKFREEGDFRVNSILIISLIIGLLTIILFNIYYGLLVVIILILFLAGLLKKHQKD